MHLPIFLYLILLLLDPTQAASTLTFYSDNNCKTPIYNITGQVNGECTGFTIPLSAYSSYMVTSIDATCAVTIYSNDVNHCSSSTTAIASLGACFTNYTNVEYDWFSVDCEDINAATTAQPSVASTIYGIGTPSVLPITTSTPSPSSSPTEKTNEPTLSKPAKIGIIVGVSLFTLFTTCLTIYLVRIHRRRRSLAYLHHYQNQHSQPPTYSTRHPDVINEKDAQQAAAIVSELMGNHHVEIHSSPYLSVLPYRTPSQSNSGSQSRSSSDQGVSPSELETPARTIAYAWPWLTEGKADGTDRDREGDENGVGDRDGEVLVEQGQQNRVSRCIELDAGEYFHARTL